MESLKYVSHHNWIILTVFLVGVSCDGLTNMTNGKPAIYIGGFFSFGGSWDSRMILPSVNLALDHINENPNILSDYELKMKWNDTECDPNKATLALYQQLYMEPIKLAFIGDGCSVSTQPIAANAGFWNMITVSYAAASPSLSDREQYPRFFRTIIPDSMFNPARIHLMKKFGWNRVATLHGQEDIFISAVDDLEKRLEKAGIDLITSQPVTSRHVYQVIDNLKNDDVKIITLNMYDSRARQIFCEAYLKGMLGEGYVWMLIGWYQDMWWDPEKVNNDETVNCTKEEMTMAVESSYYISTEMQQIDDSGNMTVANITAEEYREQVTEYLNRPEYPASYSYDDDGPLGYDAAWAIALMLDKASEMLERKLTEFSYGDETLKEKFFEVLSKTNFAGVSGEVEFDSNGDRMGKIQIRQFLPECNESWYLVNGTCFKIMPPNDYRSSCNELQICPDELQLRKTRIDRPLYCCQYPADFRERLVAHYTETTDEIKMYRNFTWPGGKVPTDSTPNITNRVRVYEITQNYYLPIYIISIVGILLCVFLFTFNTIYGNKRIIKLSSPGMNNLVIMGCLLIYLFVFPASLENSDSQIESKVACRAYLCLSSLGFVVAFGAMVSKTWRVYKIAVFKGPKRVVIKNSKLYVIVAIMVCIDVVILSVQCYFLEVATVIEQTIVDPVVTNKKTEMFFQLCVTEHQTVLTTIQWGYQCIFVMFGIFFAWQTRKITFEGLNDSKSIGICIYKLGLLLIAFLLYSIFALPNPAVAFLVSSAFYLYYTTFILIVIFGPKIWSVLFDNDTSPKSETPSNISNSVDTFFNDTDDGLRDKLNKSESEIKRLKEHIRKAGKGNGPSSGCGVWCFGAGCGCCISPELWKVSTDTATQNHTNGD